MLSSLSGRRLAHCPDRLLDQGTASCSGTTTTELRHRSMPPIVEPLQHDDAAASSGGGAGRCHPTVDTERRVFVRHCNSCDMDISLCYQCFGNPTDPAVILVGGLNMQSYAWDEGFCEALVQRSFYVIRFDNRDIGFSTKIEDAGRCRSAAGDQPPARVNATGSCGPSTAQQRQSAEAGDAIGTSCCVDVGGSYGTAAGVRGLATTTEVQQPLSVGSAVRPKRPPKLVPWKLLLPSWLACGEVLPYTLEDMALDALALLDVLGFAHAHVFGISMGGMISQLMALIAPHRVRTLTCIMSSTNAKDLPHPAWWVKLWMLRKPASNSSREQLVEFRMKALQGLLYGCVPVDESYLKSRIALSLNRSSYADGLLRQAAAIMRAPSRDDDLRATVVCPCLVIHGQNDVLCRIDHGYRLAKVLRNSKLVVFKNMGHYLNPAYFDAIVEEFLMLVERGQLYEAQLEAQHQRHNQRVNRVSSRYEDVV